MNNDFRTNTIVHMNKFTAMAVIENNLNKYRLVLIPTVNLETGELTGMLELNAEVLNGVSLTAPAPTVFSVDLSAKLTADKLAKVISKTALTINDTWADKALFNHIKLQKPTLNKLAERLAAEFIESTEYKHVMRQLSECREGQLMVRRLGDNRFTGLALSITEDTDGNANKASHLFRLDVKLVKEWDDEFILTVHATCMRSKTMRSGMTVFNNSRYVKGNIDDLIQKVNALVNADIRYLELCVNKHIIVHNADTLRKLITDYVETI